jgi:hypothetical protein
MRSLPAAIIVAAALVLAAPAVAAVRQTADRPDDLPQSEQVHVMYVLPSDEPDRGLDENGTLANSVASWQRWLQGQTDGRGLKLDTASGELDVTFVRLAQSGEQIAQEGVFVRDEIEKRIGELGFAQPNKVYAVYYDGPVRAGACGGGAWPPDLPGSVAAMYLHGELPPEYQQCDANTFAGPFDPPGYLEFAMVHEVLHTIGFAPQCSPHQTRSGHVSDSPTDLMYAGDEAWTPEVLDFGGDDYFGAGVPGCLDLSTSPYLERNPSSACVSARAAVKRASVAVRKAQADLKRARKARLRARARAKLKTAKRRLTTARNRQALVC